MNIAVLGNPNSWYLADLQRAANKYCSQRIKFQALPFSTIQAGITNDTIGELSSAERAFHEFDCLLIRTMPPGSLEQVIFRMNALHLFERSGGLVLNCARSIEIAVDKYLSLGLLAEAKLPVPETIVCQTAEDALFAYEQLGGEVVIKPIFGGEGRGITRLSDRALAVRAFRMLEQLEGVIYVQKFIEHGGSDIRVFVLGHEVFCMRRENLNDWRTNISLGGQGQPYKASSEIIELARQAAALVKAEIAGVDIVFTPDGAPVILEVNAVPGWRELTGVTGVDIGLEVTRYLAERIRTHSQSLNPKEVENPVS
ncbi:MAG: RimK family alpha-L-glutamate ligase [Planctomycetota bacterium]|nr:RimK family alpha-L-glutamate ligase [Planctomycetota bacterium]